MIQGCKSGGREAEAALAEALYELQCSQRSSKLVAGECSSTPEGVLPEVCHHCTHALPVGCLHLAVLHHCALHSF